MSRMLPPLCIQQIPRTTKVEAQIKISDILNEELKWMFNNKCTNIYGNILLSMYQWP